LQVFNVVFFTLLISFSFTPTAQAEAKGSLHVALTLEPSGLDPAISADTSSQKITYQNLFEGLTRIDDKNQVQSSLAKSWKVDKTGLVYTFVLHKKIYFHDRSELTATIVKSSLERMIAPNSINPIKSKFINIDSIAVISKHAVRIKLIWADANLLYNLGLAGAVIEHPKSWAGNVKLPIGTGPYRFVDWQSGQYIRLVANHYYWGKLARIKNIKISFIAKRTQLVDYLNRGMLDGYANMTEVGFLDTLFSTRQDYILERGNTSGEIIVAMNHGNDMLASLSIRKAITLAIDKKKIAETPNFIMGAEIGSHYSPNDVAYVDLTQAYPFNIADAKQLIDISSITMRPLRLVAPPTSYAKNISLHVKEMLKEIGITVIIEDVTWEEWLTRVYKEKQYDLTVIAHTEPHDLDIYAQDEYYFNYENDEYKQIIRQLNHAGNEDERNLYLQKAQQKLSDDAVNVFLFMLPKIGVWHKKVAGYWINEPIPALIFSQMYWKST